MRKIFVVCILSVIFYVGNLSAQTLLTSREPGVRHSKGMKGVNVGYYLDKYGYACFVGFSYNLKSRQMIQANVEYGQGTIKLSDYKDYGINASWKYTLFKIKSRFFTNAGIGAYFEYEYVDNFEFQLVRTYTVLGVVGCVEEEIYLFQGLYLTGKITQFYNSKTQAKFSYGGGLKYNF